MANLYDALTRDEIVSLLENGEDINTRNSFLSTPFIYHCSMDNEEAVITLIDYGCDVELADEDGYTGLYKIIENGNTELLTKVLQYDVIRNIINIKTHVNTYLRIACRYGYVDIFDILISYGGDPNSPSINGTTPLIEACSSGSIDIVNRLIALNVDVNAKNDRGLSALFYCQSVPFLHQLMIGGINLNSTNKSGQTALFDWVNPPSYMHTIDSVPELIETYVDYGGNPNIHDNHGKTALIFAIDNGNYQYVKTLLSISSDVNLQDDKGKTALIYALQKYYINLDLCKVLLEGGSDPYIRDNDGKSAIDYAKRNNLILSKDKSQFLVPS